MREQLGRKDNDDERKQKVVHGKQTLVQLTILIHTSHPLFSSNFSSIVILDPSFLIHIYKTNSRSRRRQSLFATLGSYEKKYPPPHVFLGFFFSPSILGHYLCLSGLS